MTRYADEFYRGIQKGSQASAEEIVPIIMGLINPKRVVDVGCGNGDWLSVFMRHGVEEVLGVDFHSGETLRIPGDKFLKADLEQPLNIDSQFDLVMSLEVAEHLHGWAAEPFVESLTNLGPVVLFSASIPFQGGVHHLNEQWPEYWASLFRQRGYVVVDCVRKKIWNNLKVEWWYAQNILIFVKADAVKNYPSLQKELEPEEKVMLSVVHPTLYASKANMSFMQVLSALPGVAKNALRRRIKI